MTAAIALFVFFVCIVAAVLWADLIEAEPPATAAERRFWPGDVVEDDGEYHD